MAEQAKPSSVRIGRDGNGVIVIDDFTGGIDLLNHPTLVADNMSPSATNCWATGGVLTKRPGRIFYPIGQMNLAQFGAFLGTENTAAFTPGAVTSSGRGGVLSLYSIANDGYASGGNGTGDEYLFYFFGLPTEHPDTPMMGGRWSIQNWPPTGSAKAVFLAASSNQSRGYVDVKYGRVTADADDRFIHIATGLDASAYWPSPGNLSSGSVIIGPLLSTCFNGTSTSVGYHCFVVGSADDLKTTGAQRPTLPRIYNTISATARTGAYVNFDMDGSFKDTNPSIGNRASSGARITPVYFNNLLYIPQISYPHGGYSNRVSEPAGSAVVYDFSSGAILTSASHGDILATAGPNYGICRVVTGWPVTHRDPVIHKNYCFIIHSYDKTKLQWSALGNLESWPTNNYAYIPLQGDGDPILKLIPYGGNLVIIKKRSMFMLIGDVFDPSNPQYSVQQIDTPIDFTFEYMYAATLYSPGVEQEALFSGSKTLLKIATKHGIYTYSGGTKVLKYPDDELIRPAIESSKTIGAFYEPEDVYYLDTAKPGFVESAFNYGGNYILSLAPAKSGVNEVHNQLIKDYRGSWWNWNSWRSTANGGQANVNLHGTNYTIFNNELYSAYPNRFDSLSTANYSVSGDATANSVSTAIGIIQHFTTASSDIVLNTSYQTLTTIPITADWYSKVFNVDYAHFHKYSVYYTKQPSGTLVVGYKIDGGSLVTKNIDMSVGNGGTGGICKATMDINNVGHSIQFYVKNGDANVTFELLKIECTLKATMDEDQT